MKTSRILKILATLAVTSMVAACGGGGSSNETSSSPDNTITAKELLATGNDVVPENADITLVESQLILSPQDKLTINGKLTIGGNQR